MTIKEFLTVNWFVENNYADLIQIRCNDYRACRALSKERFIRQYRGRDVWFDVASGYCFEKTEDGETLLTIVF